MQPSLFWSQGKAGAKNKSKKYFEALLYKGRLVPRDLWEKLVIPGLPRQQKKIGSYPVLKSTLQGKYSEKESILGRHGPDCRDLCPVHPWTLEMLSDTITRRDRSQILHSIHFDFILTKFDRILGWNCWKLEHGKSWWVWFSIFFIHRNSAPEKKHYLFLQD